MLIQKLFGGLGTRSRPFFVCIRRTLQKGFIVYLFKNDSFAVGNFPFVFSGDDHMTALAGKIHSFLPADFLQANLAIALLASDRVKALSLEGLIWLFFDASHTSTPILFIRCHIDTLIRTSKIHTVGGLAPTLRGSPEESITAP
jgi:hypothetical protein